MKKGFTLFELLLAMAIFAGASALVIPIAAGLLADRELVRGGDQIRGELTRLRVHAIRAGRVMVVHCNPDSGELQVASMFSSSDSIEAADATAVPSALLSGADQAMGTATPASGAEQERWTIELPSGVVVRSVVTSAVGGGWSVEAAVLNSATGGAPSPTSSPAGDGEMVTGTLPPIYFYPTGQTSNAIITIAPRGDGAAVAQAASANVVRVQVRGLTGDVTLRGNP